MYVYIGVCVHVQKWSHMCTYVQVNMRYMFVYILCVYSMDTCVYECTCACVGACMYNDSHYTVYTYLQIRRRMFVCQSVHVCMYVIYKYTYTYIHTYMHTYMHAYIHVYTYVYTHVYSACVFVCICEYMYVYISIYIYIYICIYIYVCGW